MTTHDQRKFIENKVKEGWTSKAISQSLGISKSTSQMGRPNLGSLSTYSEEIRQIIKRLRKKNPGWGPEFIILEMKELYDYQTSDLPSPSNLYLFLKQSGFIKEKQPAAPLPTPKCKKAKYAHYKWEMDAKGARLVQGIGNQSLINIKDDYSKKYCMAFPVAVKNRNTQPATIHYMWALRIAFTESGLPKMIQVDKDSVFIENTTKSPFPRPLHLWLIALGIELCFIDRPPPAENSMVERSHQTFYNQAMKGKTYPNWGAFFKNILLRRKRLNEKYPSKSLGKKAPLQLYPEAVHSGAPFCVEQEAKLLDLKKVYAFLAKSKWYRLVGASSRCAYLGGHSYYLKKVPPKRSVTITKKLIFHDVNEQILIKLPIKGISIDALMGNSTKELANQYKRLFKTKDFPF